MANWYWRVVRRFALDRFGIGLSRSSCLNWLHRLGFAFKRPKKRLLKADEAKREAFVAEFAILEEEAGRNEARIFFADEAHFRADAELRGKWVLKGQPALVDSTSPRYGEKASYYSAVCLETGEVEWMELEGNSNSGTSVAFLTQLRGKHSGPLLDFTHFKRHKRGNLQYDGTEWRGVSVHRSWRSIVKNPPVQRQLLLPVPSIILAGSPPVSDCAAGPLRCGSWGRRIPG